MTGGVAVQELLLGEGRASDAHTSSGIGGVRGIRPYCIQLMLLLRGAKRRERAQIYYTKEISEK